MPKKDDDPCDIVRQKTGTTFECCSSCHDDWEELDIEMCYVTIDSRELHVCCSACWAYRKSQEPLKS